jgi:hypothetical protein
MRRAVVIFGRGDKTDIELFIAGVRGWEAGCQQLIGRLVDGK